jgi:ribose/xylose/arabinose/galactoside ABC-type transport system permease subunit
MKSPMSQLLITLGVVLVLVGLLWPVLQKMGLGRLPGDIVMERENFRFYFPLTTSIIVSLILTLLFWLFRR